jgi:hypothetical protein
LRLFQVKRSFALFQISQTPTSHHSLQFSSKGVVDFLLMSWELELYYYVNNNNNFIIIYYYVKFTVKAMLGPFKNY